MSIDDLVSVSVEQDSDMLGLEKILLQSITDQVTDYYGDYTGDVSTEVDYIREYIENRFEGDFEYIIENFETVCNVSNLEESFDTISRGIVDILKSHIGICFDLDRENVYFSDIYSIYCLFVLAFRNTLTVSTLNHYRKYRHKINIAQITIDKICDYCLSDEFSPTDEFISNLAQSGELTASEIQSKIDDNVIFIDEFVFSSYIYRFVTNSLS